MRAVYWSLGAVAAAVVAAVVALPIVANGDAVRQRLSDAAREATGRALTFGNVAISLPTLSLVVDDVRLSGDTARIGAVALSLDARALLRGKIVIAGLTVSDPRIALGAGGAAAPAAEERAAAPADAGADSGGTGGVTVSLRSLRVERGALSLRNAAGEETFAVTGVAFAAAAPAPDRPVTMTGRFALNDRPVTLAATLGTPDAILSGAPFAVEATLESGATSARYEGSVGTKPVSFDGEAVLETASVAEVLAWAGRALSQDAPDPGSLRFAARLTAGENGVIEMTEATLAGDGVDARATGRFDASGAVPALRLDVEAGEIDLDRYLPRVSARAAPSFAAASAETAAAAEPTTKPKTKTLSTDPFDPGVFGAVRGEGSLRAATLRFHGREAGPLDLAVTMTGAGYRATLRRLGLHGGALSGDARVESSDGALAVEAAIAFDGISLAEAAEAAGSGNINGALALSAAGAHLRALTASLVIAFDASLTDAAFSAPWLAGASSLSLAARAKPGARTEVSAALVHDGAPAKAALTLDELLPLAEGNGSDLVATLDADVLDARWAGAVAWRPALTFDGALTADAPSVAALSARLGRPLPEGKPDPGSLRLEGAASFDASRVALSGATVRANALAATGDATLDLSAERPRVTATLDVASLDIEALAALAARPAAPSVMATGPSVEATAVPAAATAPRGEEPSAWSDEPIDVAGLRSVDADLRFHLSDARYRGAVLDRGDLSLRLDGGALRAELANGAMSGGAVSATATVDGGGETLGVDYSLNAAGVSARPLLAAFTGADNLSGILDFSTRGTTAGASPAALVSALNGDGALTLTDGALEGIELEGVDIAGMLYRAMAAALDEPEDGSARTVFESVGGSFTMRNGEVINEDMTARAPLFGLSGSGRASLPRRTLDYRVVTTLAAQAGGDNILAGIPVPVTISGPWPRLEYKVAWERILEEVASDPARVAALPAGLAIGAAELGIELPAELLGGGALDVLDMLEAVGEALVPPADSAETLELPIPDPMELLGDLFGD